MSGINGSKSSTSCRCGLVQTCSGSCMKPGAVVKRLVSALVTCWQSHSSNPSINKAMESLRCAEGRLEAGTSDHFDLEKANISDGSALNKKNKIKKKGFTLLPAVASATAQRKGNELRQTKNYKKSRGEIGPICFGKWPTTDLRHQQCPRKYLNRQSWVLGLN